MKVSLVRDSPAVRDQGYQRLLLFTPGVGQNVNLHAPPTDRTARLPNFCFLNSFNFIFSQTYSNIKSEMCHNLLVVAVNFVLP